jgi:hypothetical protein
MTGSESTRLTWIGIGGVLLAYLQHENSTPIGGWVYSGIGFLVSAFWFWKDESLDNGPRWDIALAIPFMALLWPVVVFAMPWYLNRRK